MAARVASPLGDVGNLPSIDSPDDHFHLYHHRLHDHDYPPRRCAQRAHRRVAPPASTIRHDTRRRASGQIIAAMVALAILIPAVAWLVMAVTGRVRRRSSPRKATGRREPERA